MLIDHLTSMYSQGVTDIPDGTFYQLDNCKTNFSKAGQNCTPEIGYTRADGFHTFKGADIGSFAIFNSHPCPLGDKNGFCIQPDANTKNNKTQTTGDPIDLGARSVVDARVDLKFPIEFSRLYNSKNTDVGRLGIGWSSDADKGIRIPILNTPSSARFSIDTGVSSSGATFFLPTTLLNTTWIQVQDGNNDDLFFIRPDVNSPWTGAFNNYSGYNFALVNNNYVLTKPNGDVITYDSNSGGIISEHFKNGSYLNYSYSNGKLTQITNNYGQWISFAYSNYANVITQINASNGDVIEYNYTNGYLSQAIFNGVETYTYVYAGNGLIIDKYDENNQHYTHYDYDDQGQPINNYMFDQHGNQINSTVLDYSNPSYVTETKQNGSILRHYFALYDSATQYVGTVNMNGPNGQYTSENLDYDNNGNLTSEYNVLGTANTTYTYDSNNLVTSMKKENGATVNYTWDTVNKVPLTVTEQTSNGSRVTTFTYDSYNNITSKVVQGNNETLSWLYSWTNDGRILSKTQPNGLTYTYSYFDIDGSASSGLVKTITTNTGKTITINGYDSRGNATSITGVDGITKTMTYDIRGRLLSETVNGATNSYIYDLAGNLISSIFANGYQLNMAYDPAHRLIQIQDNKGGLENFVLDSTTGKPLNTNIYQSSALVKTLNTVLDSFGNTIKVYKSDSTKALNIGSVYNDGSIKTAQDPNGNTINRYITNTGLTSTNNYAGDYPDYYYDLDNNLTSVNVNAQVTNYTYDDFGRLTQLVSPDSGTQSLTYSTGAGITTRTDANGTTHTTTKNADGNVISMVHSNSNRSLTENYEYNATGKINKITDYTGNIQYSYDGYGFLSGKTQTTNGKVFNTSYTNNNLGQTTAMTYPSGMVVNYTYDKGFLTGISVGGTSIVSGVAYNSLEKQPVSWTLGGHNVTMTRNVDGGLTNFTDSGVMSQGLSVDAMLNINSITDSISSNNNISASFTAHYSMSSWTNANGPQSLYNATNSNISSVSGNGTNDSWSYVANSNKISSYTNSPNITYSYDNNGNLLLDNKGNYTYDLKNNMISANRNSVTGTYVFNALSQRVSKIVGGQLRYFTYNANSQLIGEYDQNGSIINEYIYFGNRPVAVKNNGNIYMVHTDYLGTPRYIMDSNNNLLWKWEDADPYGNNLSQGPLEFNLRFAGQYYDSESGLHYNIHRTYDPTSKRYMQSDPLGLAAGFNTYNYVNRNPLNNTDYLGLNGNNVMIVNFYPTYATTDIKIKNYFPDDSLVIITEGVDVTPTNQPYQGELFGMTKEFEYYNQLSSSGLNFPNQDTSHGDFNVFGPNGLIEMLNKFYPNYKKYKKIYLWTCNAAIHQRYIDPRDLDKTKSNLAKRFKDTLGDNDVEVFALDRYLRTTRQTPSGTLSFDGSFDDKSFDSINNLLAVFKGVR